MKYLKVLLITVGCLFGVSTYAQTKEKETTPYVKVFDSLYNGVLNHYVWNGDVTFSFSDGAIGLTTLKIREVNGDTLVKGEAKVVVISMSKKESQELIRKMFTEENINMLVSEARATIKQSTVEFKPKK